MKTGNILICNKSCHREQQYKNKKKYAKKYEAYHDR